MKLIELVDNILDKAENDPEFGGFFLDGQVIAIDDYLEIRPEKRAQVEKCIREYAIFKTAKQFTKGDFEINPQEFLSSEFVPDSTFSLIINALLLANYGSCVLGL